MDRGIFFEEKKKIRINERKRTKRRRGRPIELNAWTNVRTTLRLIIPAGSVSVSLQVESTRRGGGNRRREKFNGSQKSPVFLARD